MDNEPTVPVIGQHADYFRYDPDGLPGPPTPRNTVLEDWMFGKQVMEIVRSLPQPDGDSTDLGGD